MTSTAQHQLFSSGLLRLLSYPTACTITDGYFRTLLVLFKANAIIIVVFIISLLTRSFCQHYPLLYYYPRIVRYMHVYNNRINIKYKEEYKY